MRSYSEDVADAVIQGLTILIFEKQLFCLHGSQISLNARKTKKYTAKPFSMSSVSFPFTVIYSFECM